MIYSVKNIFKKILLKFIKKDTTSIGIEELKEGASQIVNGLKYHHKNYENYCSALVYDERARHKFFTENSITIENMKNELIAYFNRLGQFYYFANNKIIREKNGRPRKTIPTIVYFLPFRHKYSAHRAIDMPRGENPIYMNQLNRIFSTQTTFLDKKMIVQIIDDNPKNSRHFDLLEENEKIINEAKKLLSKL